MLGTRWDFRRPLHHITQKFFFFFVGVVAWNFPLKEVGYLAKEEGETVTQPATLQQHHKGQQVLLISVWLSCYRCAKVRSLFTVAGMRTAEGREYHIQCTFSFFLTFRSIHSSFRTHEISSLSLLLVGCERPKAGSILFNALFLSSFLPFFQINPLII